MRKHFKGNYQVVTNAGGEYSATSPTKSSDLKKSRKYKAWLKKQKPKNPVTTKTKKTPNKINK